MIAGATKLSAPVRVLIVDDSAPVRQVLSRELSRDPQIIVVGVAPDPYSARDKIVSLRPDVITLDIQMPRMDGITFLRRLMQYHPIPVIIVSSITAGGVPAAIEAMAAGAVDVVSKPAAGDSIEAMVGVLIEKIKIASKVHLAEGATKIERQPVQPTAVGAVPQGTVFAIGASTGGVNALTRVISSFAADAPPILVVQHMPAGFTASFAERLNSMCSIQVKEAVDGDAVIAGRVLIAPGGDHMLLQRNGGQYYVQVKDGPKVFHQRPSVHVLFDSVARSAGPNAVGAILTGMGTDGAEGLLNMRNAGARTIAQDEHTCVVFGMPAEAIRCGAAEQVKPLDQIAQTMIAMARPRKKESLCVTLREKI